MAGILKQIFPVGSSIQQVEQYFGTRFCQVPTMLIIGPSLSMKTALLMQAAVSEGAADGQVLFIAPSKLPCLPPNIHGMPRSTPSAMENIKFKYPTEPADLQELLATLHMESYNNLPTLIVINDLQKYVPVSDSCDAAQMMFNFSRILALIQEAGGYCYEFIEEGSQNTDSGKVTNARSCSILMAWTSSSSDLLKPPEIELVAKDYCHFVWSVKQLSRNVASSSSIDYQMSETFHNASCTISFSGHRIRSLEKDIILNHVCLEVEDGNEEDPEEASVETAFPR